MAQSHDDNDWRGDIQNDQGEFCFSSINTPNSTAPDVIDSGWFQTSNVMGPAVAGNPQYYTARSRHIGGVNVALCDGSCRFVPNAISLASWQAVSTMNAGDVPGGDW